LLEGKYCIPQLLLEIPLPLLVEEKNSPPICCFCCCDLTYTAVIATKSVESDYGTLKERVTNQLNDINKMIIGNLGNK
jgi:hypothetical protein